MKKEKSEETAIVLRNDVYQSNPLIQARKKFDLMGLRIFMLGLRGLNPHFSEKDKYFDAEFKEMFIPTSKLTEIFGNTKYLAELKPACKKLFDAIVEFNYADGGFTLYHLFRRLKYIENDGLYLRFEEELRPYILDLFQARGYTRINVEYLFKLSSPYAVRLLELLLQYQNITEFKELMEIKRKLTIEELRFALDVPESAYSDRIDNFRKYVLDDPIKEINTRTPYIVRYETVKEGRNVVAFEFIMDTCKVPNELPEGYVPKFSHDALKALCALGFTDRVARAIFSKCHDAADCFSRINRAQAVLARSKKPVKNKLGFLRKAIEEDWQVNREESSEQEFEKKEMPPKKRKAARKREAVMEEDRVDDSMTPLGEIFKPKKDEQTEDSVPTKPRQINIGRKKFAYTLAETFMKAIRNNRNIAGIKEILREDYNLTIEKFVEGCTKHGL